MMEALRMSYNKRNNYTERDCSFCINEGNEDICDDCSVTYNEVGCSCHINPPCSLCEGSFFEPSNFLINYKHYRKQNKWKWECFKSNENVFNKLTQIESKGYELDAETLQTGEISITITDKTDILDIEVCTKQNFKSKVEEFILAFDCA